MPGAGNRFGRLLGLGAQVSVAALWAAVLVGGAAAAGDAPPRIDYHVRTLANGLQVYTVRDTAQSKVSVQVWYRVGWKNDPRGRSGLAHLLEHLMFDGKGRVPSDYLDTVTDAVGGDANASTSHDVTEYHDSATPAVLERVLWAEAERMGALTLDQPTLDGERHVVEQEMKDTALADAAPSAFGDDSSASHDAASLKAVTLDEVQAFHARYYRPDNAALVVVGDFQPAQLDTWIDRYFGALPRRNAPSPEAAPLHPVAPARSLRSGHEPAQPPSVVLSCPGPPVGSADAAALTVLSEILDEAQSGSAGATAPAGSSATDVELLQVGDTIRVGAVGISTKSEAQVVASLHAVIAGLRNWRAPAREVEAAKKQLLVDAYMDRETIDDVGALIGRAAALDGDVAYVNREIGAVEAVDAPALRRAARRYLQDRGCARTRARPAVEAARTRDAGRITATPRLLEGPSRAVRDTPQTMDPPAPPAPPDTPDARPAALPAIAETHLANGLRVIVARSGSVPLATAVLALHGGATGDPPDGLGLSRLAARLALFGRVSSAPSGPADTYADLGLTPDADASGDETTLSLTGLASSLPDGLAVMAKAVRQPVLREADLARARRDMAEAAVDADPDLDALADAALDASVLGAPLRLHVPQRRLRRKAVLDRYAELFRPENAVLVITGNVEPQAAFAWAARSFAGWTGAGGPTPSPPPPIQMASAPRVVLVHVPGMSRAEVAVGAQTVGRLSSARPAVELANSALGGGFTARLSRRIRIGRGLSYDVTSAIERRYGADLFSARAETDAGAAAEVAGLMLHEIQAFAAKGPAPGELATSKARLIGDLDWRTRTSADLASLLADQAIAGAPLAELTDYPRRIQATTIAAVKAAAAPLAAPGALNLVVVGDAHRLSSLRRLYPHAAVLEAGPPRRSAGSG